ncbi:collagen alpha-1(I) chain-like [Ammospiza nelsoni]|uniref:collagen alpha-1(I) chain-like n=1 Tax=Ammospiza nelsoni TaxID=2857394 RepID=UPI00286CD64C|nr:collagen alpha-1(I) chain-like [Ammospiza nelsoni]
MATHLSRQAVVSRQREGFAPARCDAGHGCCSSVGPGRSRRPVATGSGAAGAGARRSADPGAAGGEGRRGSLRARLIVPPGLPGGPAPAPSILCAGRPRALSAEPPRAGETGTPRASGPRTGTPARPASRSGNGPAAAAPPPSRARARPSPAPAPGPALGGPPGRPPRSAAARFRCPPLRPLPQCPGGQRRAVTGPGSGDGTPPCPRSRHRDPPQRPVPARAWPRSARSVPVPGRAKVPAGTRSGRSSIPALTEHPPPPPPAAIPGPSRGGGSVTPQLLRHRDSDTGSEPGRAGPGSVPPPPGQRSEPCPPGRHPRPATGGGRGRCRRRGGHRGHRDKGEPRGRRAQGGVGPGGVSAAQTKAGGGGGPPAGRAARCGSPGTKAGPGGRPDPNRCPRQPRRAGVVPLSCGVAAVPAAQPSPRAPALRAGLGGGPGPPPVPPGAGAAALPCPGPAGWHQAPAGAGRATAAAPAGTRDAAPAPPGPVPGWRRGQGDSGTEPLGMPGVSLGVTGVSSGSAGCDLGIVKGKWEHPCARRAIVGIQRWARPRRRGDVGAAPGVAGTGRQRCPERWHEGGGVAAAWAAPRRPRAACAAAGSSLCSVAGPRSCPVPLAAPRPPGRAHAPPALPVPGVSRCPVLRHRWQSLCVLQIRQRGSAFISGCHCSPGVPGVPWHTPGVGQQLPRVPGRAGGTVPSVPQRPGTPHGVGATCPGAPVSLERCHSCACR